VVVALVACAAVTLVHHAHNAHFLGEYPNLPAGLSPARIYLAWLLATALGVAGYALLRARYRMAGFAALLMYAMYGLDGLVHYFFAPPSAHTFAMNATIWAEAAAATLLVGMLAWTAFSSRSAR
jgi:hypothetical protein